MQVKKYSGSPSLRPRNDRDKLIAEQLWKCDQIARKISLYSGLPFDELRDAAREYVVKIYENWDHTKANFSTWVNRCLNFHLLNYLRDSSRLVKIPRSYSDYYLKIKKLEKKHPNISPEKIAEKLNIPLDKVLSVQNAFKIKINSTVEEIEIDDPSFKDFSSETNINLGETFQDYKDMLIRLSELSDSEESFLIDYLIKKRSAKTIIKKNSHLNEVEDIKEYAEKLISKIIH